MLGISIEIILQEDSADGEICTSCGKEIKGTKYVPMIQVGEPTTANPMNIVLCILCKNKWEKSE